MPIGGDFLCAGGTTGGFFKLGENLLADQNCQTCHDDQVNATLDTECKNCHAMVTAPVSEWAVGLIDLWTGEARGFQRAPQREVGGKCGGAVSVTSGWLPDGRIF